MGSNVQFVLKRVLYRKLRRMDIHVRRKVHGMPPKLNPSLQKEFSHNGVSFGHISDKNVQGTEITNQVATLPLQRFKVLRGESGDLK